ncbi:unnamed protein product [Prorocentrum cordatum]|uniref:IFT81 calponin homology domain-containing protein n=1 Tax=Prorocentrum cordatum TaxID=2364126 RepID=A0ABN9T7X7_9DINO|nr:unnamed protein product [Polarella glacialis]
MAAQLKEIVERLNAEPFGMQLSLLAFDEMEPHELLDVLKRICVYMDKKHDYDWRDNLDQTYQKLAEFLHTVGYQCPFDTEFQSGVMSGEKRTVHPILYWLLSNLEAARAAASSAAAGGPGPRLRRPESAYDESSQLPRTIFVEASAISTVATATIDCYQTRNPCFRLFAMSAGGAGGARLFPSALSPPVSASGLPPGSASGAEYGGSRRLAQRFLYSAGSRAGFVELAASRVTKPTNAAGNPAGNSTNPAGNPAGNSTNPAGDPARLVTRLVARLLTARPAGNPAVSPSPAGNPAGDPAVNSQPGR